jgi:hypothetical protein
MLLAGTLFATGRTCDVYDWQLRKKVLVCVAENTCRLIE